MLTVGNLLKKAREHSGKSIAEIAQTTRIRPEYLEKIEQNDFISFNSSAFIKGFIRSYASYLGLDAENIVALFRRQIGEEDVPLKPKGKTIKNQSTVISPTMIMSGALIVFFAGLFVFLIFQFYKLQQPPTLAIVTPIEANITATTPTLEVKGYTEANALVTVNGTQIQLRDDNTFSLFLDLKEGANTFKFEAWKKNIEGKKVDKIITATYTPKGKPGSTPTPVVGKSSDGSPIATQDKQATLVLQLNDQAWIQVIIDSIQKAVGIKDKNYKQTYTATKSFEFVTGRPNVSVVTIDGKVQAWKIKNGVGSISCTFTEAQEWSCKN